MYAVLPPDPNQTVPKQHRVGFQLFDQDAHILEHFPRPTFDPISDSVSCLLSSMLRF